MASWIAVLYTGDEDALHSVNAFSTLVNASFLLDFYTPFDLLLKDVYLFFSRRENKLKLPHGWICYLAPEIVRKMSPGNNEDRLPFSTAADVYAFG